MRQIDGMSDTELEVLELKGMLRTPWRHKQYETTKTEEQKDTVADGSGRAAAAEVRGAGSNEPSDPS